MALKNIFNLREVRFYNFCHSSEVLKQRRYFLLQGHAKGIYDIWLHHSDHAPDFFLIRGVLRHQGALEFHDRLNDKL